MWSRFLLGSMVSPHTGALNMPAAHLGSFGAGPGADTPCSEWSSGASTASIASHMRTCARAGDIDMRDTPACKAAPCQQPLGAPLDTAGRPQFRVSSSHGTVLRLPSGPVVTSPTASTCSHLTRHWAVHGYRLVMHFQMPDAPACTISAHHIVYTLSSCTLHECQRKESADRECARK